MAAIPPSSLQDAIERLFLRTRHGIRPGLERITALMDRMEDPWQAFVSLHVAGTNGKGSVCAMIEAVLREAGMRMGLYTSPHLVRFHERFRVDGRSIAEDALLPLVREIEDHAAVLEGRPGGPEHLTFFELTTALAFEHFRRSGVRIAVIETGMGGRWDATNVLSPLVSVITEVDVDHAEYLGKTVEAIAGEKAGIIKPGRPVVCGAQHADACRVIAAEARRQGARQVQACEAVSVRRTSRDWSGQTLAVETPSRSLTVALPLLGEHQAHNLAVAVAALEVFEDETGLTLPDAAIRGGLARVQWPARAEVIERDPTVLLDGAHNPHAARALARTLRAWAGPRRTHLVAGMLADKDAAGFAAALAPEVRGCRTVEVPSERGCDPRELAGVFRAAGIPAKPAEDLDAALAEAREAAKEDGGVVCMAGSLYLAAEVLRRRGRTDLFPGSAP